MRNALDTYENSCRRRNTYGWRPLDWLTWASWHYGVPIITMKNDPCDDWSAAFPCEWRNGRIVFLWQARG